MTASTAATVEVDVMPFLGRTDFGGPFAAYYEALSSLGSDYVRFAPWYPNPRVVVTELTPHVCNATHPSTNCLLSSPFRNGGQGHGEASERLSGH